MNVAGKYLILLIFTTTFILFTTNSGAVMINEFMPDPDDNCSGTTDRNEWIEIFIDDPYGAENITLDSGEGQMKVNSSFSPGDYVVLTKNMSAFLCTWGSQNIKIFQSSKMSLSNIGDNITIYINSIAVQRIEYNKTAKNVSYGFCDGVLTAQKASTPGGQNACASNSVNDSVNDSNETNFCNPSFEIESDQVFLAGQKQNYYLVVDDDKCVEKYMIIEYWIEDMFGREVKSKYNTTQNITCRKNISREWTADELEGSEAFYLKGHIATAGCNDSDLSDNRAEKMIVVKGESPEENSHIIINEVVLGSDGKAKFGDTVEIRIDGYKGDTSKNSINLWVENSDGKKIAKSGFNVYSKFINYSIAVPLQINPNCDGDYPSGIYTVKVEGIDSYDETEILVDGNSTSLCKIKTIEISKPCSCPACPPCKPENKSSAEAGKEVPNKKQINNVTNESRENANKTDLAKNFQPVFEQGKKNITENKSDKSNPINKIPTGKIVSRTGENWFSTAMDGIMNFFKNLFKL